MADPRRLCLRYQSKGKEMSGDHNAHQKQTSYLDNTAMLLYNAIKTIQADELLLRQALKALNYVGVDPIDREEWEETEAIIAALRERLGETK